MNGQYREGDIVFGKWKLVRKLGEGSFGKVYEAEREDFGELYKAAVKIITIPKNIEEIENAKAEGMDDQSISASFESVAKEISKEFTLMSKLKGTSNVVSYEDHDVVRHDNGIGLDIMLRMELLAPLKKQIAERGQLGREEVIKLGIDMCKALELCQKFDIIHRDIKPENIFVSELGDYKLGDFGIARKLDGTSGFMTQTGTYSYMAPEIYKEGVYNASVDIYSLGLVLYVMLNNNRGAFLPAYPAPIMKDDREEAFKRRMGGEKLSAPANADGRLAEVVLKACAFKPENRYASPTQMRQALEALLTSAQMDEDEQTIVETVKPVKPEKPQKPVKVRKEKKKKPGKKKGPKVIALLLGIALGIGAFGLFYDKPTDYEYNEQGKVVKRTYYKTFGRVNYVMLYEYDAEGNKTSEVSAYPNGDAVHTYYNERGDITLSYKIVDGKEENRVEKSYDENGNILTKLHYYKSEFYEKLAYKYDEDDRLVTMTGFDEKGNFEYRYDYVYNEEGKKFAETLYYPKKAEPNALYRDLYQEYDENGKLINSIRYNEDESVRLQVMYEYYSNGNKSTINYYDGEGKLTEAVYYNTDGTELGRYKF